MRADGCAFVVLLGDPAYYARFGFRPAAEFGLRCVYAAPPGAFQARELAPEGVRGLHGLVRYHSAFDVFE